MEDNEALTAEEIEAVLEAPEFDPEEWERKRREMWEAELAPAKAAAKQRKENAAILAEHDDILAELLFDETMRELEG